MRGAELRYEIDKIQASQRLDLNLEKGRIRDELLTQNSKSIQTGARLFCYTGQPSMCVALNRWHAQRFGSTRRSTACARRLRCALTLREPAVQGAHASASPVAGEQERHHPLLRRRGGINNRRGPRHPSPGFVEPLLSYLSGRGGSVAAASPGALAGAAWEFGQAGRGQE